MEALVGLLHKVARSTVTITASIPQRHASAAVLGTVRSGTGSVVDEQGHILTVNYVVLGASEIVVADLEGRRVGGEVVAQDFASGVAVVRARETLAASPIVPGDSHALSPGEPVFIVSSVGVGELRSSSGFVSALEPFDAYWEYRLDRALWASCANPGLGGGPVCDRRGGLVGIASLNVGAIARATLAIPAEHYFDHAAELLRHGRRISRARRPWLGVFCYALPEHTVVAGMIPGAPAERWGLEVGDVVAKVDGQTVRTRGELYDRIWSHAPGDVVQLEVLRGDRALMLSVRSADAEDFFD